MHFRTISDKQSSWIVWRLSLTRQHAAESTSQCLLQIFVMVRQECWSVCGNVGDDDMAGRQSFPHDSGADGTEGGDGDTSIGI